MRVNVQLIDAETAVTSQPPMSTPLVSVIIPRLTRMAFVAMLKKPNGRVRWFLRSLLILASRLVHLTTVATTSKLETVEQRLGAIGVLFRIRLWRFIKANRLLREYERRSGTGPFS